jgi:hypothetical protein
VRGELRAFGGYIKCCRGRQSILVLLDYNSARSKNIIFAFLIHNLLKIWLEKPQNPPKNAQKSLVSGAL